MNSCIINHRPISSSYSLSRSAALWRWLSNKNPITLASLRPVGPVRVRDRINSAASMFQLLEAAWAFILCVSPTCQRSAGCCLLQQWCMFVCTCFCCSTNSCIGWRHVIVFYRNIRFWKLHGQLKKFITRSFSTAEGEKGWEVCKDGWFNIR